MKQIRNNSFLLFSPFLVFYVVFVSVLCDNSFRGDETRYVAFAQNLLQGFYSPADELNLWNGPGYPIVLMPLVVLDLPKLGLVLPNALFHYLSIVLLYKTILLFASRKLALGVALFWGFYYIAYQEMSVVFSESLSIFLVTLIVYSLCLGFKKKQSKAFIVSGFALGYFILTKVIFWYAWCVVFGLYAAVFLFQKIKKLPTWQSAKLLTVLIVAFVTITPYLAYTYKLTGRPFYLANSGGMSLYWMSTPVEGEYGDWNTETFQANCLPEWGIPCNDEFFRVHHQEDMDYIMQFSGLERDDVYKDIAIQNIKNHPVKYFRNCIANMGRMWFGFPFSYFHQRDRILLRIPPNAILLTLFCASLTLHAINFKRISFEINFITALLLSYLFCSTLVSAYQRQFYIIVPMMLCWQIFVLSKCVKLRLNFSDKEEGRANSKTLEHNLSKTDSLSRTKLSEQLRPVTEEIELN